MGCWNSTCALTHLPITHGEKVLAFVLTPRDFEYKSKTPVESLLTADAIVYSTGLMRPLTCGIHGEYDDYGGIENIRHDWNAKGIVPFINEQLAKKQLTIYEDTFEKPKPKVKKLASLEDFLIAVGQGLTPFGMALVLESAFQAAITAIEEDTHWENSRPKRKDYMKRIRDIVREEDSRRALEVSTHDPKLLELLGKLKGVGFLGDSLFHHFGAPINLEYYQQRLRPYLHTSEVADAIIDHIQFTDAMTSARRLWMPQAGGGSQELSYHIHRAIAKFTVGHATKGVNLGKV